MSILRHHAFLTAERKIEKTGRNVTELQRKARTLCRPIFLIRGSMAAKQRSAVLQRV